MTEWNTLITRLQRLCSCGNKTESKGRYKGKQTCGTMCTSCRKNKYKTHKKNHCESCGFIPIHSVQLDVDHIDGNHSNDTVDNLMTLCANCHRLKTYVNNDHTKTNQ